ncbi:MAG: Nif3-like dinuclear metal center hexameric protein [Sutterellaceae bacterium]|nr:Nif3-like dinuclear metal center hexameric protein [Sutterellaceae bacterium]
MELSQILKSVNELLTPEAFHDYAPNGLQVQGKCEVKKIVTGVSACLDLIEAAKAKGADAIFVHHGWFWKREDPRITGVRYGRIASLLKADLSLVAYHLPLDAHPTLGNNALLGQALGFVPQGNFSDADLGWYGTTESETTVEALSKKLESVLNRAPLAVGNLNRTIRRVAWCTGAAQDMIEDAIDLGVDCFISGEISERTTHIAREAGIVYFACGHHATERFGIRALGNWIAEKHGIEVEFVDIDNPV